MPTVTCPAGRSATLTAMPAFEPRYTPEMKAAILRARFDTDDPVKRPSYGRIRRMAASGDLRDAHGNQVAPFEIPVAYVGKLCQQEDKRRRGETLHPVARLAPSNQREEMVQKLASIHMNLIEQAERKQRQRTLTVQAFQQLIKAQQGMDHLLRDMPANARLRPAGQSSEAVEKLAAQAAKRPPATNETDETGAPNERQPKKSNRPNIQPIRADKVFPDIYGEGLAAPPTETNQTATHPQDQQPSPDETPQQHRDRTNTAQQRRQHLAQTLTTRPRPTNPANPQPPNTHTPNQPNTHPHPQPNQPKNQKLEEDGPLIPYISQVGVEG